MIRGTTPIHMFTLPFAVDDVAEARVIYGQFGHDRLIKTSQDLDMDGNEIRCVLTQEETLSFSCKHPVEIQIRVLTTSGVVMASDIMTVDVGRCLDSEVIG